MVEIVTTKARAGFTPSLVVPDILTGLSKVSIWTGFAWDEIQNRYRRSRLGLAWIMVSYLIFVAAIAIFFGGFSALESGRFTNYVAVNFAIFNFLIANLTDGCDVFHKDRNWIKSSTLPHSVYIYKSIARSAFTFAISMVIALIIVELSGEKLSWIALWSIPAFFLILLNAVWLQYIFGYLAARFRDLTHFVAAITRILFFVTPIIWVRDEATGMRRLIADLNPFTHACEIFSAPILGRMPDPMSVQIMLGLTIFGFICVIIVGGYANRRLAFWL